MKTIKKTLIVVILLLVWAMIKNSVYADVEVKKVVTGTDGSIEFEFSGLELEEGEEYKWGISKFQSENITTEYEIINPDYTNGKLKLIVSKDVEKCLEILKSTDTAYISIETNDNTKTIVDKQKVDLTLPIYKAYTVTEDIRNSTFNSVAYEINGVYGMDSSKIQYNWVKITDVDVINNYVDKDCDLSTIPVAKLQDKPSDEDTSWKTVGKGSLDSNYGVQTNDLPSGDGLYYLWIKSVDPSMKTIYGCQVIAEGTITKVENPTDNEDENKDNENAGSQENNNNNNDGVTNDGNTGKEEDPTVAPGKIAQAGISNTLIITILVVGAVGIIGFIQYKRIKQI